MKHSIEETPDGKRLVHSDGLIGPSVPSVAELEFWAEIEDLKDTVRWTIGTIRGIPWYEVEDRYVYAYLNTIKTIKKNREQGDGE